MFDLKEEVEEKKVVSRRKLKKGNLIILLLIIVFISASIFAYLRFDKLNSELNEYKALSNSGEIEQEMVRQVLDKVGELILLPDETPTVAAITNTSGLKKGNPSFYKNAIDGDILIIFTDKAILYRESDNIIVNVAPVFIEPSQDVNTNTNDSDGNVVDSESDIIGNDNN